MNLCPHRTISYNTMLKGYCSTGDLVGARAMCEEMTAVGMPPNNVSFNCMLNIAASSDNFSEASRIIRNVIAHSTNAKGYAMRGDLDKVLEILRGTQEAKVSHNSFVCSTILDGCAKHRRPDLVNTIPDSMKEHSILLTNYTLIHGHCAAYFCILACQTQ